MQMIAPAIKAYGLPATLKLSVHFGSGRFSIYPVIKKVIQRGGASLQEGSRDTLA